MKHLKRFYRNLAKNRVVNGINILGLSVGIAAILLIWQHIQFEKSYDNFLDNKENLYRLVFYRHYSTGLDKSVGNSYVAGQMAYDNIPEIEDFMRCKKSTELIKANNEIYKEERTFFADSSFFSLFSYPILEGDPSSLLNAPNTAVISESLAIKYFGKSSPIGKTITLVNYGDKPLTVKGVAKDTPDNTHLKFDLVISLSTITNQSYCYTCNNTNTYFQLAAGSEPEKVVGEINQLAYNYFEEKGYKLDMKIEYKLQRVSDIHLHSNYRFEHETNGNYTYLLILSVVALFIALSALLNYTNIYESIIRKKKVSFGIQKINGTSWKSLFANSVIDTFNVCFISLILSYIFLMAGFPLLKEKLQLGFSLNTFLSPEVTSYTVVGILLTSIIIGLFIGIKTLRTSALAMVQSKTTKGNEKRLGNKFVLVLQFGIAIILITGSILAIKQINFMQQSVLSMDMDQILVVKRPGERNSNLLQKQFEERLTQIPGVSDVSYSTIAPGQKNSWVKGGVTIRGLDRQSDQLYQSSVAPNFFNFFGVQLLAGRFFYEEETNYGTDSRHVILNKEAAQALGADNYSELIGKQVYDSENNSVLGEIAGVVDGYFQNSLEQQVNPTIFNPDQYGYYIFTKIKSNNPIEVVDKIKAAFKASFTDSYVDMFFLDDLFNQQYKQHIQFKRILTLFSFMAVIISMLSILGIAILGASSRIKEIGIRKVNGAKISEVMTMLNKDFILWVGIAFVVATPISWFVMNKWLENFAYKTSLSWWIFALAGLLALGIAILTVSWQSWRAAARNPVEALRYE
ncbi:ABC transporter permease [Maribellus maritimus]|uniref:ABC transporter permease n=1 Tax=Maribellus maritimus TaxID=2870838 RepID=UPI001EEB4306|nr:ABC transporter permease [Maribellus maritimus]MCG6189804.1 ABC transporter permease [Maribellus maritimus]